MDARFVDVAAAFARLARARSAGLLGLLGAALAVRWFWPPGGAADAAGVTAILLLVAFAAAHPRAWTFLGAGAFFAHVLIESVGPTLPVAYADRLRLEAFSALLPPFALAAVLVAARRAGVRAPARPLAVAGVVIAALGSLVRLGEVYLLFDRPGDAFTIWYVLRHDGAYALWGLGAFALAATFGAAALVGHVRRRRRTERVAVGAAFTVFLLVALDLGAVVVAVATPRPDMLVGFHADRVSDVPEGADLVHLEAAWPRIERSPGERHWESLERELDAAGERGLGVYLLVNTYPPDWLAERHPDAVMVDDDGDVFTWIDEAPGAKRERVWDLSFADERVVAAKKEFLAAALERFGDHPAVRYVAVQNEPAYPVDWNLLRWASFDPHTLAAFRHALEVEFGSHLAFLNQEYGTEFESWSDVRPPSHPFGGLGARWVEFREDLLIAFVADLVATARDHTDRPVTVKVMAHTLTRFAEPQAGLSDRVYRAFARMSDVVSVDLYPVTQADLARSVRYFAEIAQGKPLIVAEFHLALGSGLPSSGARTMSALRVMEEHVDVVIMFTASRHYLYGAGEGTLALAGARLFEERPGDPGFLPALRDYFALEARATLTLPRHAFETVRALLALA